MSKFALRHMKKIFVELRSHLRGVPSDHDIFINDIKSIDELSIDLCPIVHKCKERYELNKSFVDYWIYFIANQ